MEVGLEKGDLNWMMLALLDDEFQEKAIKKYKPKLVTNLKLGIAFVAQICSNPARSCCVSVYLPAFAEPKFARQVRKKKKQLKIDLHEGSIHVTEGEEGGEGQKTLIWLGKKKPCNSEVGWIPKFPVFCFSWSSPFPVWVHKILSYFAGEFVNSNGWT